MSPDATDPPARVPIGLRASPRALARLVDREAAMARYAAPALRRTPKRAGAPMRLSAAVLPPTWAGSVGLPPLPATAHVAESASHAAAEVLAWDASRPAYVAVAVAPPSPAPVAAVAQPEPAAAMPLEAQSWGELTSGAEAPPEAWAPAPEAPYAAPPVPAAPPAAATPPAATPPPAAATPPAATPPPAAATPPAAPRAPASAACAGADRAHTPAGVARAAACSTARGAARVRGHAA